MSILTGSKNAPIKFPKHAKASLVVVRLPELIVVFKGEDRDTRVPTAGTVEADQSGMLVGYRSHCRSVQ